MIAATASDIALPVLNDGVQRPTYANGPRSLSSVKLLRISVTDRCNLRCMYCMPEGGMEFHDRDELLQPADFEAVARAAVRMGIRHLKVTGGEPTVRRDLLDILSRFKRLQPDDLSLTTNGLQLNRLAEELRRVGVDRLTLSVDSLRPDRYRDITGGGRLDIFQRGLEAATDAGFERLKFNVVVIRGVNDDEVADLAAMTLDHPWTVRFIEYMPLGQSRLTMKSSTSASLNGHGHHTDGSARQTTTEIDNPWIDNELVKQRIAEVHGPLSPADRRTEPGVGPAQVFQLPGARGRLGFISAMSRPFCESCNRLRLTSTGELRSCLFDGGEVSIFPALRPQPDEAKMVRLFSECVAMKPQVHSRRGNRAMSQIGG